MLSILLFCIYVLGIVHAIQALMSIRSATGAVAWIIALLTLPYIAIPLYWLLGRNKFQGYVKARRTVNQHNDELVRNIDNAIAQYSAPLPENLQPLQILINRIVDFPYTTGNQVSLLINGQMAFKQMLEAIAQAQRYILMQFYIVNDDRVGRVFQQALIAKAQQGLQIYFIYDEIGSHLLPAKYVRDLKKAGVHIVEFGTAKNIFSSRFQVNFRNHRKLVLVDGDVAFVGGLNLGDEYIGRNPELGAWRDTNVCLRGTAVQCLQVAFLEDWYWATRWMPDVSWEIKQTAEMTANVLIFPTSPADDLPRCTLLFVSLFALAKQRLWIASPYFVPDSILVNALQQAALRGVDVRILIPSRPDHLWVYLAGFSYYQEMLQAGVKLYRYRDGFMHQKVLLIDDMIAGVGTVNLDNRSFRLNFELTAFIVEKTFIQEIEQMLLKDFEASELVDAQRYEQSSFFYKITVQTARLFAPML